MRKVVIMMGRLASTRLPNKMLLPILGTTIWQNALKNLADSGFEAMIYSPDKELLAMAAAYDWPSHPVLVESKQLSRHMGVGAPFRTHPIRHALMRIGAANWPRERYCFGFYNATSPFFDGELIAETMEKSHVLPGALAGYLIQEYTQNLRTPVSSNWTWPAPPSNKLPVSFVWSTSFHTIVLGPRDSIEDLAHPVAFELYEYPKWKLIDINTAEDYELAKLVSDGILARRAGHASA